MKDIVTPVPPEEVRQMIKKSLETAALVNYTRLSSEAKIEDDLRGDLCVPPAKKLEDLIHLAELCVDLLQQNEEHYAEVSGFRKARTLWIFCCLQAVRMNASAGNSI